MKKTLLLTTAAVLFSFSVQAAPAANQTASAPKETKTIAPYASVKAVYSWEKVKLSDDESPASSTFKAPGLNMLSALIFRESAPKTESALKSNMPIAH